MIEKRKPEEPAASQIERLRRRLIASGEPGHNSCVDGLRTAEDELKRLALDNEGLQSRLASTETRLESVRGYIERELATLREPAYQEAVGRAFADGLIERLSELNQLAADQAAPAPFVRPFDFEDSSANLRTVADTIKAEGAHAQEEQPEADVLRGNLVALAGRLSEILSRDGTLKLVQEVTTAVEAPDATDAKRADALRLGALELYGYLSTVVADTPLDHIPASILDELRQDLEEAATDYLPHIKPGAGADFKAFLADSRERVQILEGCFTVLARNPAAPPYDELADPDAPAKIIGDRVDAPAPTVPVEGRDVVVALGLAMIDELERASRGEIIGEGGAGEIEGRFNCLRHMLRDLGEDYRHTQIRERRYEARIEAILAWIWRRLNASAGLDAHAKTLLVFVLRLASGLETLQTSPMGAEVGAALSFASNPYGSGYSSADFTNLGGQGAEDSRGRFGEGEELNPVVAEGLAETRRIAKDILDAIEGALTDCKDYGAAGRGLEWLRAYFGNPAGAPTKLPYMPIPVHNALVSADAGLRYGFNLLTGKYTGGKLWKLDFIRDAILAVQRQLRREAEAEGKPYPDNELEEAECLAALRNGAGDSLSTVLETIERLQRLVEGEDLPHSYGLDGARKDFAALRNFAADVAPRGGEPGGSPLEIVDRLYSGIWTGEACKHPYVSLGDLRELRDIIRLRFGYVDPSLEGGAFPTSGYVPEGGGLKESAPHPFADKRAAFESFYGVPAPDFIGGGDRMRSPAEASVDAILDNLTRGVISGYMPEQVQEAHSRIEFIRTLFKAAEEQKVADGATIERLRATYETAREELDKLRGDLSSLADEHTATLRTVQELRGRMVLLTEAHARKVQGLQTAAQLADAGLLMALAVNRRLYSTVEAHTQMFSAYFKAISQLEDGTMLQARPDYRDKSPLDAAGSLLGEIKALAESARDAGREELAIADENTPRYVLQVIREPRTVQGVSRE